MGSEGKRDFIYLKDILIHLHALEARRKLLRREIFIYLHI